MSKKALYEAPEAEILVAEFERNFCETDPFDSTGLPGYNGDKVEDQSNGWH